MTNELVVLLGTAITIAVVHTLTGPDHYLPFIALARSRGWSFMRTFFWTIVCGCGHVWSSVLLGLGGAALGWSLGKINRLEGIRGGIAGWLLLAFGLLYLIWGIWRARNNKPHKHFEAGDNGNLYVYEHRHGQAVQSRERHLVTPWVMFIIFLLGPCEPMIPLLFFPAAQHNTTSMLLLILVYTLFTLLSMLLMVVLGYYGLALTRTVKLEKYMHAIGGFTILICGAGMVFMDW